MLCVNNITSGGMICILEKNLAHKKNVYILIQSVDKGTRDIKI